MVRQNLYSPMPRRTKQEAAYACSVKNQSGKRSVVAQRNSARILVGIPGGMTIKINETRILSQSISTLVLIVAGNVVLTAISNENIAAMIVTSNQDFGVKKMEFETAIFYEHCGGIT